MLSLISFIEHSNIEQTEFIVTTHILGKIFAISMPLSRQFQTENIDLVKAFKVSGDVQMILQRFRENVVNLVTILY